MTQAHGKMLTPETMTQVLRICFKDDGDKLKIGEVTHDSVKQQCDASFTIDGEQFHLSVLDEAVEECDSVEAIAELLLAYNMPDVVKSMPDFRVSVTVSGCILGSA